jgi:hypothetical protein|nr:MAG: hypothetical protein KatS3mg041_2098 [Bacteroidota bacterium]
MPHIFETKTGSVRTELRLARLAQEALRRQLEETRKRLQQTLKARMQAREQATASSA